MFTSKMGHVLGTRSQNGEIAAGGALEFNWVDPHAFSTSTAAEFT